jgi:sec-independent protein translocase protein TatB
VFNLSGSEIIVILLLALVVLGPDKLPDAMRKAGKTFAELKKLTSSFQDEVRKGFEEPTNELRKTAQTVKEAATVPGLTKKVTSSSTASIVEKPHHNPEVDPVPEPPAGSSVAPSIAAGGSTSEADAAAGPPIDTTGPAPVTDADAPVGTDPATGPAERPGEATEPHPAPTGSITDAAASVGPGGPPSAAPDPGTAATEVSGPADPPASDKSGAPGTDPAAVAGPDRSTADESPRGSDPGPAAAPPDSGDVLAEASGEAVTKPDRGA